MTEGKNIIDETRDKEITDAQVRYQDEVPVFTERKRLLFFGLPWTFTKYLLKDEILTTNKGFFKTVINDCYMYKIVDVQLEKSLIEKMFGLGTVVCYTSDTTDKIMKITHVRHAEQIKNFILEKSEKMRMKRRTLTTMSLNSDATDVADDIG
ncbi:MAG: PH domain-containing protein [Lachnospiraceae bacterium]|nr:PH domain-containing protein [Lachnospiraceae bacterium]MBR4573480.1 PH domain-containing protein [Lachnospiraceae bacterium]